MATKEIKELQNTLLVNDQEYNINAIEANHVENPLIIYKSNLNKKATKLLEFDGSTSKNLEIVPASGGSFAGRITVPPVSDATLKANSDTVLNYNDTVSKVVDRLLNTSAMATWDGSTLTFTDTDTSAVNGICVVLGINEGIKSFSEYNYDNWLQANSENPPAASAKWLPNYLYISTDTGNIYLGAANSTEVIKLASTVGEDTNGVLPIKHGGTGADSIEGTIANLIDGNWISPQSIQVGRGKSRWLLPGEDTNSLEHDSYGINMRNSDIINLNSLWFADKTDSPGEGIMFLHRIDARASDEKDPGYVEGGTTYNLDSDDSWDRFFVKDGMPYLVINENTSDTDDSISNKTSKVFHSKDTAPIPEANGGTGANDLTKVTVGSATNATNATNATKDGDGKEIKKNYYRSANNNHINSITIAASTSYPDGPTGGEDGDIMILY